MESENSDIKNCPGCGSVAQPDDKFCPNCGIQLNAVNLSTNGSKTNLEYFYWENRGQLGSARAFWKTWKDSTFRPFRFFGNIKPEYEVESSISYFLIIILLAAFAYIPSTMIYTVAMQLQGLDRSAGVAAMSILAAIGSVLFVIGGIGFSSVVLVISASVIFVMLKLLRVQEINLKQINRVILYSSGSLVISASFHYLASFIWVWLIAAIWSYILICIGLRKITKISFVKIISAVTIAWSISISIIIKTILVLSNILGD